MWEKILNILSKELSQPQFESWIKPISFINSDESYIYLAVPSEYHKSWILQNLYKAITQAALSISGKDLLIKIKVDDALAKKIDEHVSTLPIRDQHVGQSYNPANKQNLNLNLKYTFDSFIVGTNNKFAYAVAKSVADNPGQAHNPLFIYGGVGVGKTHLMQAIGHQVYSKFPGKKIKYVTTESFTNELIESIRRKNSSEFRSRYRLIDLLLLDDVQFLEGKEATQEEFFNTFNALHEAGKQIVLSSDRPPKHIANLTERLISRFEWGVIVDIQTPGLETRIAILKNKALKDKMDIPLDVLELIASAYQNNIRELEGALNRVIAYVGVTGAPMTVESVRGLIESTSKTTKLSPDIIISTVAEHFKLTSADLKGSSRLKDIAHARQIAIYLTREINQLSFPSIGNLFSKKHSTIIYSYDKMKEELKKDYNLATTISELISKIT